MKDCEVCDGRGVITCQVCGGSGSREETWEEFEAAVHRGHKDADDIFNRLVETESKLAQVLLRWRGEG
jgi:DnaJ-class molecular chaperone